MLNSQGSHEHSATCVRGWHSIEGAITERSILPLLDVGHIDHFSITKAPTLNVGSAKLLRQLHSVSRLWLWCDVSRIAMRHVLQVPGLEVLDVLALTSPGRLSGFDRAQKLQTLRANHCLSEADLIAIAKCPSIRELGIQGADLTEEALKALLELPFLESLDLEGTPFTDRMARMVSRYSALQALDLGATRLTRAGLLSLLTMPELRSLDLWATGVSTDDLELLRELPKLEYLSVGGYSGSPNLDAERVVVQLLAIPSLKRVWLDGVGASDGSIATLRDRGLDVRVT